MNRPLLLSLLMTGCATAGTFQTAHTVGPGGWEAGGDLSAVVIADPGGDLPWLVMPRLTGRAGISERTELGGSLGLDGLRFGPKVQLTDPNDEGVVVSLAGGVRLLPLPNPSGGAGLLFGIEEAVLVGLPTGPGTQLVLVGRGAQDLGRIDGNQAVLIWGGGSVGWSVQANDWLRLMPEVGAMTPVYVADGDSDGGTGARGVVAQAGFGVVFGQRH